MAQIANVALSALKPNPHRALESYPFIPRKVESLIRSINDVGMWESIIARPSGDGYQIAFGHHRVEAARQAGIKTVPVIVKDLTDEQMLQYMGRENGEDYSTDFLVMLNTWEGAVKFGRHAGQDLSIAKLLGWVSARSGDRSNEVKANDTAQACAAAYSLLTEGHINRSDLRGLSVRAAGEIVARTKSRIDQTKVIAQKTDRPEHEVKQATQAIAKAAQITARQVRDGEVTQKELRSKVDENAYKVAIQSKVKESPLFAAFGTNLVASLEKMLKDDSAAERLQSIVDALPVIRQEQDKEIVRNIDYWLGEVALRAQSWQKKTIPTSEKVVALKAIGQKGE
jgi:ParB-like chromosome segregation protein Spo0J